RRLSCARAANAELAIMDYPDPDPGWLPIYIRRTHCDRSVAICCDQRLKELMVQAQTILWTSRRARQPALGTLVVSSITLAPSVPTRWFRNRRRAVNRHILYRQFVTWNETIDRRAKAFGANIGKRLQNLCVETDQSLKSG